MRRGNKMVETYGLSEARQTLGIIMDGYDIPELA